MKPTPEQLEAEARSLTARVEAAAKLAALCWNTDQAAAFDLGIRPGNFGLGGPRDFAFRSSDGEWLRVCAERIVPSAWAWQVHEYTEGAQFVILEFRGAK